MNALNNLVDKISHFILYGINGDMGNREFLEQSIMRWKGSPERLMQIKGHLYYINEHDILLRKRTMIGEDGRLQAVENLPNNHQIDNQYAKMVNQKTNYLFGQPFAIETDNEQYAALLKEIFNKRFMRILKKSAKDTYNGGISWLFPYYDQGAVFPLGCSQLMKSFHFGKIQTIPGWMVLSVYIWFPDMIRMCQWLLRKWKYSINQGCIVIFLMGIS